MVFSNDILRRIVSLCATMNSFRMDGGLFVAKVHAKEDGTFLANVQYS